MKNKFIATTYRFHTKDKNKFLVIGWFRENTIGNNELRVCLDKKKIHFTMEEKDFVGGAVKALDGLKVTKQYFLWIDLPKGWEACRNLQVMNFYEGEGGPALEISTKRLQHLQGKMAKYIDGGNLLSTGFRVSGWYIDDGTVELGLFDKSGKKYDAEIKRKRRSDVQKLYPENSADEIVGFEAVYKGDAPKKVIVHLESSTKKADFPITLVYSPLEKGAELFDKYYRKARAYYQQFGFKETVKRSIEKITVQDSINYKAWIRRNAPTAKMLQAQREAHFQYAPKISIVVPLYKTPENYLREFVQSVQAQTYKNWELCFSDGSGKDSPIEGVLNELTHKDPRIRVVYTGEQLQISENTNEALKIAAGDFIAFSDHDDLLAPDALYECVKALNEDRSIELLYTDEDKVDMKGKEFFMPHFKPDFNIDLLRCNNYICHLFVVKREILEQVGMLNPKFDGAQDYDFVLRCVEKSEHIHHIPKILYHWRAHKDSTAENPESKEYAFIAGGRAVQAHYARVGIDAEVMQTEYKGIYRSKYHLHGEPLISIIIPNKDHTEDLEKCISSIENKATYKNVEYIVVENNSEKEETFAYYKELEKKNPKAKVVFWDGTGFNYPAINNFGVEKASGEYLLFLNNDTEIVNEDCLEELLGYCMREDVGAVGARLYYEDGSIQHAGVIVGLGGVAGHAFTDFPHESPGYFGRIVMAQDYSAVTAACMMMRKNVYEEVGGFDPQWAVAFNDVDLCLKIRKAGYLIVYNPYAELMHYESKSRGYEDNEEKVERFNSEIDNFMRVWKEFLDQGDPYYSPNLTLDKNDFSLRVK